MEQEGNTKHWEKGNVVCKTGDVPLMNNIADICRECERNPEISKEMHDLLCDVLTDCDIADGMRAEITRVVKIWEEESE